MTWALCGASALLLTRFWDERGHDFASTAGAIVSTVVSLFGVLSVWAWRRTPRQGRSSTEQLTEAQRALALLVERQWRKEAGLRQLHKPVPLPVSWSDSDSADSPDSSETGVRDHPELIGGTISCRADQVEELAAAFRRLPRRRLVVLGPAGSGKSTFAVLLALSLLHTRQDDEPVPVLFTAASFDPAQGGVSDWLCRRVTADYPALADADTYGPSAIDDLLAGHRVLPVIDGLDELPEEVHAAVLTALNETLDTDAPVVLTCRTDEYTAAVASAAALAGAAVVEPADLSARESLRLLRLATPTGASQRRWDSLADHLGEHPEGAVAQAFTSPLIVALARTVYAEGAGDPGELRDFETREAIEDHLLDTLVPTVYATARRRDPAGRPWSPEHAHRYLAQLASGMQRQRTYDLAWWQLHRWVPAVSRTWARSAAWTVALIGLTLLSSATLHALPGIPPEKPGVKKWYVESAAVALPCMCWLAAWIATRPRLGAHRLTGTVLTAACGGLAFAVPGMVSRVDGFPPEWYAIGCVCIFGFAFLLVLHSAGPPAPPHLPSRGTLTPGDRPRRLLVASAAFLGTTVLTAAAFHLYALVVVPAEIPDRAAHTVELPWAYGLVLGALFGALQALLYWTRGTTSTQDLTHPVSTVRADRLVTLVGCSAGFLLVTLPLDLLLVLGSGAVRSRHSAGEGPQDGTLLTDFADVLLGVGPTGLILALAAHAWPYYTAARLLLSARGRLPWRLQSFLDDAHRLGILRQVGPVYQFRHARLQQRLARPTHVPGPRAASSTEPDLRTGPASLR
ncbi:NACHT domain-containing protein [Streptomyces hirsutus]|uniref:NACHT domain-containing protein n=1 Tax=Streptomyces hirsutus TaxID=35620 RepID=UPI003629F5B3